MHVIRSRGHELTVDRIRKSELSAFDDKRYLLDDGQRSRSTVVFDIPFAFFFFSFINVNEYILDLSHTNSLIGQPPVSSLKNLMYDIHYNFIRKRYKDNAVLLLTDTDSFFYLIRTRDIYQDISENRHLFDLSNYPQNLHLYDLSNLFLPLTNFTSTPFFLTFSIVLPKHAFIISLKKSFSNSFFDSLRFCVLNSTW
jgi:hypothetical protein